MLTLPSQPRSPVTLFGRLPFFSCLVLDAGWDTRPYLVQILEESVKPCFAALTFDVFRCLSVFLYIFWRFFPVQGRVEEAIQLLEESVATLERTAPTQVR